VSAPITDHEADCYAVLCWMAGDLLVHANQEATAKAYVLARRCDEQGWTEQAAKAKELMRAEARAGISHERACKADQVRKDLIAAGIEPPKGSP
jgi:hypothetical protein